MTDLEYYTEVLSGCDECPHNNGTIACFDCSYSKLIEFIESLEWEWDYFLNYIDFNDNILPLIYAEDDLLWDEYFGDMEADYWIN